MKLTVLSILILMLVAGLAMIQMDANTENQIQVLRETEMLTTQGLGDCELAQWGTDVAGDCATKVCFQLGFFNLAAQQTGQDYMGCRVQSNTMDCVEGAVFNPDGSVKKQTCATGILYRNGVCLFGNEIGTYELGRDYAVSVPGCDDDGGGSTTS